MTSLGSSLGPPRLFVAARGHLRQAQEARTNLIETWNAISEERAFGTWIEIQSDSNRELWCSFAVPDDVRNRLEMSCTQFVESIKRALDTCILSTATATYGLGGLVIRDDHTMPMCSSDSQFEESVEAGRLAGLRPDQVDVVRRFQPFADGGNGYVGHHVAHLAAATAALAAGHRLFTAWAGTASPQTLLPPGVELIETLIDAPGTLTAPKRLAVFRLLPADSAVEFLVRAGTPFDPILDVPPWPASSDDNCSARSSALLTLTDKFIDALERSANAGVRVDELVALEESAPATPTAAWLPVHFDESAAESEVRAAIQQSDRGMATYRMPNGSLTYLRLDAGQVIGREIGAASALAPGGEFGPAVEDATRAAAARWGLPDFVLSPRVVAKGSGIREIGDGTILSGRRGIALQVKARNVCEDSPERAAKWLMKNSRDGLRQARGTIRTTLGGTRVTLTNLRKRDIEVAGAFVSWIPVVVLDHPNPPLGVIPDPDPKGPCVVLTRQDWEFLWAQLRSSTAIVDYVHRVAEEAPIELGAETNRYFDLADRDWAAPPNPVPDWVDSAGGESSHLPTLPKDPADSADELGHEVFQRILEDIAATQFTGDETRRVQVLSLVDQVAVAARADLGRLLLRRMIKCASAAEHEFRLEHRLMYVNDGELHLSFTTMTLLTGYQRHLFQTWVLHRRQRFLDASKAQGPVWPWTVGVLLTPRFSAGRLWDTTTIATNGPPHFDEAEYGRLAKVYDSLGGVY